VVCVTEFVDTKHPDLCIIIDSGFGVISLMDPGDEAEGGDTGSGITPEDGLITNG